MDNQGLKFDDWQRSSEKFSITIADIENLSADDELEVLILDRNVLDIVEHINEAHKCYDPKEFFRCNRHTYKHNKGLSGVLNMHYGGTENDVSIYNFEFEMLIQGNGYNFWCPLENEHLELNGKHWNEYPKSTKVGLRGSMIKWEDLSKLPNIYFTNEEDEDYE